MGRTLHKKWLFCYQPPVTACLYSTQGTRCHSALHIQGHIAVAWKRRGGVPPLCFEAGASLFMGPM